MLCAAKRNIGNVVWWDEFARNKVASMTCSGYVQWFPIVATLNGSWRNLAVRSWYPARWATISTETASAIDECSWWSIRCVAPAKWWLIWKGTKMKTKLFIQEILFFALNSPSMIQEPEAPQPVLKYNKMNFYNDTSPSELIPFKLPNTEEVHKERIRILPWKEGGCLILTSHGDNALGDTNPETTIFVGIQNVRCFRFGNFRFRFVVTNNWFSVSPATEEDFNHRESIIWITGQNQMGIIWCTNSEIQQTVEWIELVFQAIGCVKFCEGGICQEISYE